MKENSIVLSLNALHMSLFKALSIRYKKKRIAITPVQGRILLFVYENNCSLCQKDIEVMMPCNKSTLSAILNTMEKNGLITRSGSVDDLRKKIIGLTDKAISFVSFLQEDNAYIAEKLCEDITTEEVENLSLITQKIKRNLERI